MRAIGLISITLATIVLTTTDVRGAGNRWCAIYTQRNCTFATFEQCRAQVLGFGGWCQPPIRSLIRRSGPVGRGPIRRASTAVVISRPAGRLYVQNGQGFEMPTTLLARADEVIE
jgi:hypothetical protein